MQLIHASFTLKPPLCHNQWNILLLETEIFVLNGESVVVGKVKFVSQTFFLSNKRRRYVTLTWGWRWRWFENWQIALTRWGGEGELSLLVMVLIFYDRYLFELILSLRTVKLDDLIGILFAFWTRAIVVSNWYSTSALSESDSLQIYV